MTLYPAYKSVGHFHTVPTEARRCPVSPNWSYRLLRVIVWLLETQPALNC